MDQKKAGAWKLPLIKIAAAMRLKRNLGESPFQLIDPFEKYTPSNLPLSIEANWKKAVTRQIIPVLQKKKKL